MKDMYLFVADRNSADPSSRIRTLLAGTYTVQCRILQTDEHMISLIGCDFILDTCPIQIRIRLASIDGDIESPNLHLSYGKRYALCLPSWPMRSPSFLTVTQFRALSPHLRPDFASVTLRSPIYCRLKKLSRYFPTSPNPHSFVFGLLPKTVSQHFV
ncbi:hypothetical protein HD806DRAFT_522434 [Xylariaceae sp. AK1471]|nr:hypothetical protein HD806DRAFT_522434 [Xylariaceae sp. AK1471]